MARERFDSGQGQPFGLKYNIDAPAQFGGNSGTYVNVDTGQGSQRKDFVSNPEMENVDRYREMGKTMGNRGAYQLDWGEADQDRAMGYESRGLQYDANKLNRDQALGLDRTSYNMQMGLANKGAQAQTAGALSQRGGALAQMSGLADQGRNQGGFMQKARSDAAAQQADDMASGRAAWMQGTTAQRQGDQSQQYLSDQQAEAQAKSELAQRELNDQGRRKMEGMGVDTRRVALSGRQGSQAIGEMKERAKQAAMEADRARSVGMMNDVVGSMPVFGGLAKGGMQAAEAADTSDERAKNIQPNKLAKLATMKWVPGGSGDSTMPLADDPEGDKIANINAEGRGVYASQNADSEGEGRRARLGPARFSGDTVNRADAERARAEAIAARKKAQQLEMKPKKKPLADLLKESQEMLDRTKAHTEASLAAGPAVKVQREEEPDRADVNEIKYGGKKEDDTINRARPDQIVGGGRSTPWSIPKGERGHIVDPKTGQVQEVVGNGDSVTPVGVSGAPMGYAASRRGQAGDMFGGGEKAASTGGWDEKHDMAPGTRDFLKYGTPSKRSESHLDDYSKAVMVSGTEAKIPATLSDERTKKTETPEEKKAREDREDKETTEAFMGKDTKPQTYEEKSKAIDEQVAQDKEIKRQAVAKKDAADAEELIAYKENRRATNRQTFGGRIVPNVVHDYFDKKERERETGRSNEDLAREARELAAHKADTEKRKAAQVKQAQGMTPQFLTNAVGAVEKRVKSMVSDEEAKSKGGNALHELQQDANRHLEGQTYTYKEGFGEDPGQVHHGFMAQNLEKNPITATAVREDESGLKKVDMQDAVRVTAAGVAENQDQIDELEAAIAKLKSRRRSA